MANKMFCVFLQCSGRVNLTELNEKGLAKMDNEDYEPWDGWEDWTEAMELDVLIRILKEKIEGEEDG